MSEVAREGLERAHGLLVPLRRYGNEVGLGSTVDPCRVAVDPLEQRRMLGFLASRLAASSTLVSHRRLLHTSNGCGGASGDRGATRDILLNGITPQACHQWGCRNIPWTMLINGHASTIGHSVSVLGCFRVRFYADAKGSQFLPGVSGQTP